MTDQQTLEVKACALILLFYPRISAFICGSNGLKFATQS